MGLLIHILKYFFYCSDFVNKYLVLKSPQYHWCYVWHCRLKRIFLHSLICRRFSSTKRIRFLKFFTLSRHKFKFIHWLKYFEVDFSLAKSPWLRGIIVAARFTWQRSVRQSLIFKQRIVKDDHRRVRNSHFWKEYLGEKKPSHIGKPLSCHYQA